MMSPELTHEEMSEKALAVPAIQEEIGGRPVRKTICVPGRLVNIVV